jgi:hypothetical protein
MATNQLHAFNFEKQNVVYYGNIGLQLGTFTNINLSPTIGYRFTDKLIIGIGPMYNFISYSNGMQSNSNSIYGARVYAKYFILENLYAIGDYQYINAYWTGTQNRTWQEIPMLGVGYRRNISGNVYFDFSALWILNPDVLNYYSNPLIRGGISFMPH